MGDLDTIATELMVDLAQVERVLYRIQRFEPTGVGGRDVVECLLIQVNAAYPEQAELRELVEQHLEPDLPHALGLHRVSGAAEHA